MSLDQNHPWARRQNFTRGRRSLVVVGLDVGDARVVVDGDVQVRVAHRPALAFGLCAAAAVDAPTASWGGLADLLDVEVYQLTLDSTPQRWHCERQPRTVSRFFADSEYAIQGHRNCR